MPEVYPVKNCLQLAAMRVALDPVFKVDDVRYGGGKALPSSWLGCDTSVNGDFGKAHSNTSGDTHARLVSLCFLSHLSPLSHTGR